MTKPDEFYLGAMLCELSLEVAPYKYKAEPKFVLHLGDEDYILKKYVGKSSKGMNRMIRKCIGRLNP